MAADKPLDLSTVIAGQSVLANGSGVFEMRPVKVTDDGAVRVGAPATLADLRWASGAAADSGNNLLITPAAGARLQISYVSYNPSAAVDVSFRFGTAGAVFLRNVLTTGGAIIAKDFGNFRCVRGGVDEALYLSLGGAVSTIWNVFYTEL